MLTVYRSAAFEGTSDFFPIKPLQKESLWIGGEQLILKVVVCWFVWVFLVGEAVEMWEGMGTLQT